MRPERRLTAAQVERVLEGKLVIALATVAASGAPRVMPVDALFLDGRFHWTTDGSAARIAHLQRDPRCSATWFDGDSRMVTVHGRTELIDARHADYEALELAWEKAVGSRPSSWGEHIYHGRIHPERMYAFAQDPTDLDS